MVAMLLLGCRCGSKPWGAEPPRTPPLHSLRGSALENNIRIRACGLRPISRPGRTAWRLTSCAVEDAGVGAFPRRYLNAWLRRQQTGTWTSALGSLRDARQCALPCAVQPRVLVHLQVLLWLSPLL